MHRAYFYRLKGLTRMDVLVLLTMIMLLGAMASPAIQAAREKARRAVCINNLKQLGLAFHNFHDAFKRFPPSSDVTRDPATGKITAVKGWSFFVHLLPYMEHAELFEKLNVKTGFPDPDIDTESTEAQKRAALKARDTQLPELLCPSNLHKTYVDPEKKKGALTNYKAMGATHLESLSWAWEGEPMKPKYPLEEQTGNFRLIHPDGALPPGWRITLAAFGKDGTANTILCTETIDDQYGIWTYGRECVLVGLPSKGWTAVLWQKNSGPYWAPEGYNGQFGQEASEKIRALKTYLAYDFAAKNPDAYQHLEEKSVLSPVGRRVRYGPSAGHPNVVNHLFADGAVYSISKEIDFCLYMFLITKNGGDPTSAFFESVAPPSEPQPAPKLELPFGIKREHE